MKYISVMIRDTLLTVGISMLVPVEVGDGQKRVSDDVLNLPNFEAGGVVRTYLPNIGRLLEY